METLGARVRRLRKESGLTQEELVNGVPGMSASALSQLENGDSKGMRPENLIALARKLGVSPEELVEGEARGRGMTRRTGGLLADVPVVGYAIATPEDDGFFDDMGYPPGAGEGYVPWPTRDLNAYALRVKGDSMQPRIRPGELIVVQPNTPVLPGHDVVVRTKDGRKMVKQLLYQRGGEVSLGSINQAHKQLTLSLEQIESMHYVAGIAPPDLIKEKP